MSIAYHRGDERPPWQPTVRLNGDLPDLSVGHTFTVRVGTTEGGAASLEKTTGITGFDEGVALVEWAVGELDLAPGNYFVELTCKRTSDNYEWTIFDDLIIRPRMTSPV